MISRAVVGAAGYHHPTARTRHPSSSMEAGMGQGSGAAGAPVQGSSPGNLGEGMSNVAKGINFGPRHGIRTEDSSTQIFQKSFIKQYTLNHI